MKNNIYFGDTLKVLKELEDELATLIYIKPPINLTEIQVTQLAPDHESDIRFGESEYVGIFSKYLAYLDPLLREAYRLLSSEGTLYFHCDYRKVHYCKAVLLDDIFGRERFLNEIIWACDIGDTSLNRWPAKHENILVYVKDTNEYVFNLDNIDRIPYMAPDLVGPHKRKTGKLPTDTWWDTLVTGNIIDRIIEASTNPGDIVLDLFATEGSTGESCIQLSRNFVLIENNLKMIRELSNKFNNNPRVEIINLDSIHFG